MGAPLPERDIVLFRDSLTTPWGFRLQGGKDFKAPLSVQRVFVGSPADGELQRGDVIVGINDFEVTSMIHKQAMDIIKDAGGTMLLRVHRYGRRPHTTPPPAPIKSPPVHHVESPQYFRSRPLDSTATKPMPPPTQYGVDYSRGKLPASQMSYPSYARGFAPTSNQNLWSAEEGQGEDEYQARSVKDLTGVFLPPSRPAYASHSPQRQQYHPPQRTVNPQPAWTRPDPYNSPPAPAEPGWTPKWSPVKAPSHRPAPVPVNRPQPVPVNRPAPQPVQQPVHYDAERPAWMGSLKSSGSLKPWEAGEAHEHQAPETYHAGDGGHVPIHQPRVQHFHHGPGGEVTYEQHQDAPDSDTAQVKHLQYNSPLGLYSKDNVQEVLEGQTRGKPGYGTMQVTSTPGAPKIFDPNSSEVLKLLHEEEAPRRRGGGGGGGGGAPAHHPPPPQQSARYTGPDQHQEMHYAGYVDHNKQSPAMARLGARFGGPPDHPVSSQGEATTAAPEEFGTSDF